MKIGNPPRSAWRNFPDVLMHSRESAVKMHADYRAAKSGEIASARRVVESALNDNMVKTLGAMAASSDPVLASVHAYEAEGINRVPAVFAEVLAERLGLRAEAGIVQSNRTGHTGATGYHRLAHPALFEGEVERGRDYLLVDDFVGQGGTIANLKGFIEVGGGTAIGCTTLTGKPWSAKLTPSAETLRMLREKHGGELESWWQDTFGYGFDFLTESEARYLARADSVELIRNRILAARQAHDD
jgi:hypoxanthine-guanine phosphoribosyltransferase